MIWSIYRCSDILKSLRVVLPSDCLLRAPLLFVVCINLAACTRSVLADYAFHPPRGWIGTPSAAGRQFWIDPHDAYQGVMVIRPGTRLHLKNDPPRFSQTSIVICGDHPAALYRIREVVGHKLSDVDWIETSWNGQEVGALYFRRLGTHANDAAEEAIRSLCPLPSAST